MLEYVGEGGTCLVELVAELLFVSGPTEVVETNTGGARGESSMSLCDLVLPGTPLWPSIGVDGPVKDV